MSNHDTLSAEGFEGFPVGAGRRLGRTMVIGTADGIRQVLHQLKPGRSREVNRSFAGLGISIEGCVLLKPQPKTGLIGTRVLGLVEQLPELIKKHELETALVCVPRAMYQLNQKIIKQLQTCGVQVRRIQLLHDVLCHENGGMADPVDVGALLNRRAVELDEKTIRRTLGGKRVLITGAGGSIGSQLAHMVAQYEPSELLLMERSENGLFDIDRELAGAYPDLKRQRKLHDVTDAARTGEICEAFGPDIVFHAAAHKHVPMMEDHPTQAIHNNLMGTKAIADAALRCGAERFVMISTDKAVNPTSVMGATKRLAERYVQSLGYGGRQGQNEGGGQDQREGGVVVEGGGEGGGQTLFSIVRFGNVLGSACSVVPIWTQQLAKGGPLTVTDPRMTRYFMTIPEAAALVVQAATMDDDNARVYLLDMGEPIQIMDLAKRFIESYGLTPDYDVDITLTGIRPGEKLHEELVYSSEDMLPTGHGHIHTLRASGAVDVDEVRQMIVDCCDVIARHDDVGVIECIKRYIPDFQAFRSVAGLVGAEIRTNGMRDDAVIAGGAEDDDDALAA